MDTPKPILFCDFDGVLCHDLFWRSLPIEQFKIVQKFLFDANREIVYDWMTGKYSAEEISALIADHTGLPYSKIWDTFVDDSKSMKVHTRALDMIKSLGDRYVTILITMNMDSFSRFTIPHLKLDQYFQHIVNTYHEGVSKTENNGGLFQKYADKHTVPIADCIMFDDHQDVIEVFGSLGGKAYLISPEKDIEWHLKRVV